MIDGSKNAWMYVLKKGWMKGWMKGRMNEWKDGWKEGWMNEWMNTWIYSSGWWVPKYLGPGADTPSSKLLWPDKAYLWAGQSNPPLFSRLGVTPGVIEGVARGVVVADRLGKPCVIDP